MKSLILPFIAALAMGSTALADSSRDMFPDTKLIGFEQSEPYVSAPEARATASTFVELPKCHEDNLAVLVALLYTPLPPRPGCTATVDCGPEQTPNAGCFNAAVAAYNSSMDAADTAWSTANRAIIEKAAKDADSLFDAYLLCRQLFPTLPEVCDDPFCESGATNNENTQIEQDKNADTLTTAREVACEAMQAAVALCCDDNG